MKRAIALSVLFCVLFALLSGTSLAQQWANYTTVDGLIGNSIWLIQEDQKGYLWFTTAFGGATRYDGVLFQNFNTTHGLASNNVYFTLADKEGNLWFATDRGVSKYDGRAFENFDASKGLASDNVTFILQDRQGRFWFATDRGVSKYDGEGFQNFDETDGLSSNNITYILQDREGNLWFGTSEGVNKYDGQQIQPLSTANLSDPIQVMFEDRDGTLWFGTEKGVYKKSVKQLRIEGPFVEENILSILEDQEGNLWFGTHNQGVIKFDARGKHFAQQQGLIAPGVLSMLEDSKANLWFGTDRGVSRYDGRAFQNFAKINDIALNFVRCILEDGDANLWFGTENGIFKYTVENLRPFTQEDGLASDFVRSIVEDADGNLWMGTENGVSEYDGSSFQNYTVRDGLCSDDILSVFQDSKGNLWFGTIAGVSKNIASVGSEKYLRGTSVRTILEDRKGNLWFATAEGVSKYDGEIFQSFPVENGLEMFLDSRDNVWIGSWDAGLYKYDGGDSLRRFTMEDGLASNYITWILETHDGNLWFGLKGGLSQEASGRLPRGGVCRYDGVSFLNFSTEDGLLSDYTKSALEDREGNLWFGTDKGIMKYDGRPIEEASSFQAITKAHGLMSNYVTALFSDRAGNLWFGTDKGVSKYDGENFQNISLEEYLSFGFIENIFEDRQGSIWCITTNDGVIRYIPPAKEVRPRIHITRIEADKIYSGIDKIKIPTAAKRITFEYKGISFKSKPERMRYTYRLSDHDTHWRPSTHERRVHYENVAPGTYQFQVRAIDADLHYSDPPATVTIRVFRPFYRSVLFILISVICGIVLLGGAGYLIAQLKKQRLLAARFQEKLRKQQEAERVQASKMESLRQLVAGVAHEINNPIGAISSSSDVCRRAIGKVKEFIKAFPREIKESQQLGRTLETLENSNKTTAIASEKIARIVANLRSFVRLDEAEWQIADIHQGLDNVIALMQPGFEDRIKVTKNYGDIPRLYCSPSSLNQVFMCIIKNAVEAIEEQGEIAIRTYLEGEYVKVAISDTGRGIPEENMSKIFDPGFTTKGVAVGVGLGLSICYKIVTDEYQGRIDVSSKLAEGTTFTIALRRRNGERKENET